MTACCSAAIACAVRGPSRRAPARARRARTRSPGRPEGRAVLALGGAVTAVVRSRACRAGRASRRSAPRLPVAASTASFIARIAAAVCRRSARVRSETRAYEERLGRSTFIRSKARTPRSSGRARPGRRRSRRSSARSSGGIARARAGPSASASRKRWRDEGERAEAARREQVVRGEARGRAAAPRPTSGSSSGPRSRGRAAGRRGRAGRGLRRRTGFGAQLRLQPGDQARRVAGPARVAGEPARKPGASGRRRAAAAGRRRRVAEDTAEQERRAPSGPPTAAPSISRLAPQHRFSFSRGGGARRLAEPLHRLVRHASCWLGHLVALVRGGDVRERVRERLVVRVDAVPERGCSGSGSAGRTHRSGTCRSPARRAEVDVDHVVGEPAAVGEAAEIGVRARRAGRAAASRPCRSGRLR